MAEEGHHIPYSQKLTSLQAAPPIHCSSAHMAGISVQMVNDDWPANRPAGRQVLTGLSCSQMVLQADGH